jgi:hypothetical protein
MAGSGSLLPTRSMPASQRSRRPGFAAVAYWTMHAPQGPLPIQNGGETIAKIRHRRVLVDRARFLQKVAQPA